MFGAPSSPLPLLLLPRSFGTPCLSRRQPFGVALLVHRWCLPPSTLQRYRPPSSRHPSVSEAHRVSLLRVSSS
ncbi:hypothetical protein PIB30_110758, partial [Stylosanthes scabra]|nr:hypothetical protein [Stylosanthes scabra]